MSVMARTAAAILRTNRPLSEDFRGQAAQMMEALEQLVTEKEMVEMTHRKRGHPFYSEGLEMYRKATAMQVERETT